MNVTAPLLLLLLTAACMVSGALLPQALWQFGSMISCAQPGTNPLNYNNYGCWCGMGGRGTPRDDVDVCCKIHDKCYETSRKTPGCTAIADLPYVLVYDHTCSNQQVTCSEHRSCWSTASSIASNNKCQAAVCECDRVAAHCFAQHTYNPEHKNLDPKVHCVN